MTTSNFVEKALTCAWAGHSQVPGERGVPSSEHRQLAYAQLSVGSTPSGGVPSDSLGENSAPGRDLSPSDR